MLGLKRLFISKREHDRVVMQLREDIAAKERQVAEVSSEAAAAERTAHFLVEQVRYTLQAVAPTSTNEEAMSALAHALPYVFSGRRHWDDPPTLFCANDMTDSASAVARDFGFSLPDDPAHAVQSLLELAAMLLNPSASWPVEMLRSSHPIRAGK
ncbi:hypothetical protein [Ralstonia pseudosolanacearum]|uniref:hypothetical protein n=1 Tax=Ralstonia pseudosolanacearum TaxID=1310165 RepID=UPI001FF85460|nr:hypothetical protein [Ralstonia pseudosolanacearum]